MPPSLRLCGDRGGAISSGRANRRVIQYYIIDFSFKTRLGRRLALPENAGSDGASPSQTKQFKAGDLPGGRTSV